MRRPHDFCLGQKHLPVGDVSRWCGTVKWSYRIANIAGIEVRIHATFLLLLAFYGADAYSQSGSAEAVKTVSFILLLFLCVVLHEFGHAFAARAFGIRTPDITLLPIGGVARLERMPSNPWQELVIAVAGPAVNVVIVCLLALVLGGIPGPSAFENAPPARELLLIGLFFVNIMLIVFNMIPAFPMDGGRVLRALLAMKLPHANATLVAARVGQGIAILFALSVLSPWRIPVLSLFLGQGNPMLLFIAAFVFMGAQQELAYARMRTAARALNVGQVMITRFFTLPDSLRVGDIPAELRGHEQPFLPMVDRLMHFRGMANREQLLRAVKELPADALAHSLSRDVPALQSENTLESALDTMQKVSEPVLPVTNPSGQIIGLVTLRQLTDLGRLRRD